LGGLVVLSPAGLARRQPAQNLQHPPKIHFMYIIVPESWLYI
jgi:hypothetical protein